MTVRQIRFGLAAAGVIAASILINLLAMQPEGRGLRPDRPYRGLADLPGTPSTTVGPAEQTEGLVVAASRQDADGNASALAADSSAKRESELLMSVQRELSKRGYVPGNINGSLDTVTRAAIIAFEYDRGLDLTAAPSTELIAELHSNVPLAVRSGTAARKTGPEAEAVIRAVQQSLALINYRPGAADGVMGQATAAAIRAFERDQQLPETGRVSGLLVTRLVQVSGNGRLASR